MDELSTFCQTPQLLAWSVGADYVRGDHKTVHAWNLATRSHWDVLVLDFPVSGHLKSYLLLQNAVAGRLHAMYALYKIVFLTCLDCSTVCLIRGAGCRFWETDHFDWLAPYSYSGLWLQERLLCCAKRPKCIFHLLDFSLLSLKRPDIFICFIFECFPPSNLSLLCGVASRKGLIHWSIDLLEWGVRGLSSLLITWKFSVFNWLESFLYCLGEAAWISLRGQVEGQWAQNDLGIRLTFAHWDSCRHLGR